MFVEIFIIGILAGISPGPDFFLVMKNSLGFGVRVGIATALGIAFALVIHIGYTIMGFALLFQQHPTLFHTIQLLGAAYLIWLGYHALTAAVSELNLDVQESHNNIKNPVQGFYDGFLCNLLNPKAALFFLSVFSQFLSVSTPALIKWIYGTEIIAAVALWFVTLSFFISSAKFKKFYAKYRLWFDRLLGAALLYFALRIVFSLLIS